MYCLYNWHIFLLHTWENAYANAYINNTVDIVQASLAELADYPSDAPARKNCINLDFFQNCS